MRKCGRFLQTDRVLIFRFEPNWSGTVAVESVGARWSSILATRIHDPCIAESYVEPFRQGRITAKTDIHTANIDPCHLDLLSRFQVRANLVVPILQGEHLWGLLIAHHCKAPRQWQPLEIDLLQQLAMQASIAIQQSSLFEHAQSELRERQHAEQEIQLINDQQKWMNGCVQAGFPKGQCCCQHRLAAQEQQIRCYPNLIKD